MVPPDAINKNKNTFATLTFQKTVTCTPNTPSTSMVQPIDTLQQVVKTEGASTMTEAGTA